MTVNILGTEYKIKHVTAKKYKGFEDDHSGDCDFFSKVIHLRIWTEKEQEGPFFTDNVKEMMNAALRHEIIHAFLYESGLGFSSKDVECWAINEEMVDWLAIQWGKIHEVLTELGAA